MRDSDLLVGCEGETQSWLLAQTLISCSAHFVDALSRLASC